MSNHSNFQRLPANVRPVVYDLTICPNLEKFSFTGNCKIEVSVKEATNKIVLNAAELKLANVYYKVSDGTEIKASDISCDEKEGRATFTFAEELKVGDGLLNVDFEGIINDRLIGFYRVKYTTPEGETRFGAATKFEPTNARYAFPCWDEPAIKAKFNITLIVPKNRVTVANTNVESVTDYELDNSLQVMKFATTPIMSTYLVAYAVGEYDFVSNKSEENKVEIRVYTPVGKSEQGKFALEVGEKVLKFYEDYFKISFPLSKMDLIALADFKSAAMENWGLITFRESCLLYDEKNTSLLTKVRIAIIIAHEIAHQWFGNLVTMEWWTDLWLNEGFASFIEYLSIDNKYPEYEIWNNCITVNLMSALRLDCLENSHPIEVPVNHPSEIDEIFDDISYRKGCSVIRMLYHYLGDQLFKDGLHHYLKKHEYKNAVTQDLWNALEEVSKKPIGEIMRTWTKQKGYPVLKVRSEQLDTGLKLFIKQEKFTLGQAEDGEKYLWLVPVSILYCKSGQTDFQKMDFLLDTKSREIVLEGVTGDYWVKLNHNLVNFHLTEYSEEMLEKLCKAVENKTLPPYERMNILNDLYALTEAGITPTIQLIKTLNYYRNEDDCVVWDSIISTLTNLNRILHYHNLIKEFSVFARVLLSSIFEKLTWDCKDGECYSNSELRVLVLNSLASFDDPQILNECEQKFNDYVNNDKFVNAEVRGVVYKGYAINADEDKFAELLKLYNSTDLHQEKSKIAGSMGQVKDSKLIDKLFEFSISENVRSQDSPYVIYAASTNIYTSKKAWNFFRDNYDLLKKRYGAGFLMTHLIECSAKNLVSYEDIEEIEKFFSDKDTTGLKRSIEQAIERIRIKAEWVKRDISLVKDFLR